MRQPLGPDPANRLTAALARPRLAWIGPRTGDRIDTNHLEHCPPDAARRPSADELSRRGERESPQPPEGLDSLGVLPSGRRHSLEVELAVLNRRLVGTERFLRRRGSTATVAVPNGDG